MTKPTIEIERWDHYGEGTLAVIGELGMLATIPPEWKPALLAALLEQAGAVKVTVTKSVYDTGHKAELVVVTDEPLIGWPPPLRFGWLLAIPEEKV